jgi:Fe-S-cluster containining protein
MSMPRLPKPKRSEIPPGKVLCEYCTAKCCRYFALPIDTPTERKDYDTIRWFLLHDQASVFVDDGTWYLLVHTKCRHLRDDHLCGIYETRPEICREYTTDACEYDDSWTYEQYFETPDQMAEYIEAIFPPPRGASIRSPKPAGLPVLPLGAAR